MNKKKVNKKSILKKITLSLTTCLIAVCSIIAFIPSSRINSVYADSVDQSYSFDGSNLYYFDTFRYNFGWENPYTVLFSASFDNFSLSKSVRIVPKLVWVKTVGNSMYYEEHSLWSWGTNTTYAEVPYVTVSLNSGGSLWFSTSSSDMHSGIYFPVSCFVSSGFNCNVYKVTLSLDDNLYFDSLPSGMKALNLCYYDVNDNFIAFGFYVPGNYQFDNRTYYLNNPDSFSDDLIYKAGYDEGYNFGLKDGNSNGYSTGYNTGLTEGYNTGYNVGISDSNQYSFYNLFGAVLDAPVKVFSGLFNFELLGVNLFGLITGLLTLAVIILIIKLCLGGK